MKNRPNITSITSGAELKRWYWLKAELVGYCRLIQLPYSGSKAAITERIAEWIDTGVVKQAKPKTRASSFNWATAELTLDTIITDSYTNGPNARQFFKQQLGDTFRFNIAFMNWMKENCGKTLADAVETYKTIQAARKQSGYKSDIPKSNQYNQYVRDFFAANTDLSTADARKCWAYKRSHPGHNRYEESDLEALH